VLPRLPERPFRALPSVRRPDAPPAKVALTLSATLVIYGSGLVHTRDRLIGHRAVLGNPDLAFGRHPVRLLGRFAGLRSNPARDSMQEKRRVHYKKGVFVCPRCRQSYVQEKWIEEWRIRCHRCDYRGTLTEVSVEEHMDEETFRR